MSENLVPAADVVEIETVELELEPEQVAPAPTVFADTPEGLAQFVEVHLTKYQSATTGHKDRSGKVSLKGYDRCRLELPLTLNDGTTIPALRDFIVRKFPETLGAEGGNVVKALKAAARFGKFYIQPVEVEFVGKSGHTLKAVNHNIGKVYTRTYADAKIAADFEL